MCQFSTFFLHSYKSEIFGLLHCFNKYSHQYCIYLLQQLLLAPNKLNVLPSNSIQSFGIHHRVQARNSNKKPWMMEQPIQISGNNEQTSSKTFLKWPRLAWLLEAHKLAWDILALATLAVVSIYSITEKTCKSCQEPDKFRQKAN